MPARAHIVFAARGRCQADEDELLQIAARCAAIGLPDGLADGAANPSASSDGAIPCDAELGAMSRRGLQDLAKRHGVRANMSSTELVRALAE